MSAKLASPDRDRLPGGGWVPARVALPPCEGGLAGERSRTVEVIAALLRAYAPDADADRVNAYANMLSGAAEQLGRWWVNNRHISRETITRHHAEFLWSGGRDLRDEPGDGDAARA